MINLPKESRKLLWFAAGLIVVSGLLVASALAYLRDQAHDVGVQTIESFARIVQEQMDRTLQNVDQHLQSAGDRLLHLEADGALSPASAQTMLRTQVKDMPYVRAMWVMDAQGVIVFDSDDGHLGMNLANRAYFQIYKDRPQTTFYLGAPVRNSAGDWVISASRPLYTARGVFAGIVVAALEPRYFDELWRGLDPGANGSVSLFRRDAVLMVRSPMLDKDMGQAFPDLPVFSRIAQSKPFGSFENVSPFDGAHRHYAYRTLMHYPAVIVVGKSHATMLTQWNKMATLALVVWAVAAMVLGLLFAYLAIGVKQRLMAAMAQQERDRQMQRSLLESEYRWRFAIEGAGDGLWDWDISAGTLFLSGRWKDMLGFGADELGATPGPWVARLHPDDKARVFAEFRQHLAGRTPQFNSEYRMFCKDGSVKWVLGRGLVVNRDAKGKAHRMIGTSADMTERKQAELALRQSENFIVSILNSVTAEIAVLDARGIIVAVNEPWRRFAADNASSGDAAPPRTQVGVNYLDICQAASTSPDDPSMLNARQGIEAVLAGRLLGFSLEYPCHSPDELRWFSMSVTPLGQNGQGVVIAHTNVSDHRMAEAKLQATLNAMPDLLFEVGTDGYMYSYHSPRSDLLAAPPEVFLGKLVSAVLPPAASAVCMSALAEAAAKGWSSGSVYSLSLPQGETWFELSIAAMPGQTGPDQHFILLSRDITERKRAETTLRAALDEKTALLNEVHHRVKNNLQVVASLLRLEMGRSSQPDTQVALGDMQGRIRSMALLHESLYRTGVFASVDLDSYLKQLCQQAFRASAQVNGAVRLVLDLSPVRVSLDQATPCGLLVNELLSNCFKHGFPGESSGEVRVALQALPGAQWRLTVSDNGVGLPADFEARRGSSLGLQLVTDLVQQLGGVLEVGPGPGAAFALVFNIVERA